MNQKFLTMTKMSRTQRANQKPKSKKRVSGKSAKDAGRTLANFSWQKAPKRKHTTKRKKKK